MRSKFCFFLLQRTINDYTVSFGPNQSKSTLNNDISHVFAKYILLYFFFSFVILKAYFLFHNIPPDVEKTFKKDYKPLTAQIE